MKNIMEIKRKKSKILEEARKILNDAERENRGLTSDEKTRSDSLLKEANALNAEIDNEERQQELAMTTAAKPPAAVPRDHINLTEEDRTFLKFIRKGEAALDSFERRALVEDSTGQYIISPAIEMELQRNLAKLVVVRQLASKRTIDKDRIQVRDVDEVQVAWGKLETGTEIAESTSTPSETTKYIEDIYGLTKLGEDELMDNDYDLVAYVADSFARAVAEKESLGFLRGVGHSSHEPEGITVDSTLVASAKTTAAANAVIIDDFLQMIYEIPAKYRPGSAWIVNSLTELELRKLRWDGGGGAGTGGYLWQPSVALGAPPTFLGYPIYNDDDGIDDLSDTAGILAVFGNFQMGYRILDRQGVSIQRLNELYAEAGLVGFKLHYRVGGYVIRPSNKALVLLKEHSA